MKKRKLLSVILTLSLITGMIPYIAFADEKESMSYVALGDSMSQGYMFVDYNENVLDGHKCGYAGSSERSSIKMFHKYLQEQNKDKDVKLTDLSVQGFQPDELWALFRQATEEGYSISSDSTLTKGAAMHFGNWVKENGAPDGIFNTYADMSSTYINAIANADVLTYDIGINYFGTYLNDRIGGLGTNEGGEHFTELLTKLSDRERSEVEKLRKKLAGYIQDKGLGGLSDYVDAMLYAVASYIYYTDKCIDAIYKVNPDIDLIVVGLYNPKQNMYIDVNGIKVSYSKLVDMLMETINLYHTAINKHSGQYKYADMIKNPAITFADELYFNKDNLSIDLKCNIGSLASQVIDAEDCIYYQGLIDEEYDIAKFPGDTYPGMEGFATYLSYFGVTKWSKDMIQNTYWCGTDIYPFPVSPALNALWKKISDAYGGGAAGDIAAHYAFSRIFSTDIPGQWNFGVRDIYDAYMAVEEGTAEDYQTYVVNIMEPFVETCVKAMSFNTFPLDKFMELNATQTIEGADMARTLYDAENATTDDYYVLNWNIRHSSAARGFGGHPCPLGQKAKYDNIVSAYTDTDSAREKTIKSVVKKVNAIIKPIKKVAVVSAVLLVLSRVKAYYKACFAK
ncbi:MAG: hypothetical protein MJ146_01300 [Clostridia bacterium]|nr:hypothetical protein [Clostridia bacterium]